MRTIPYTKGIEKKVIDYINGANESIKIAMAWFTNDNIKAALINIKIKNPKIKIEIVVDDNEINNKYFLNFKCQFDEVNIVIRKKTNPQFLHHKFMIIDNNLTLTGSYNFTKKANYNLENIVVIECENTYSYYTRIFSFLTIVDYVDDNIQLLLEYPDFAKQIISTYYMFSNTEYLKYKKKIELGYCHTVYNGSFDELIYQPGLIFNPKIKYKKNITKYEFKLPINKDIIKTWIASRNMSLIIDRYNGNEDQYHLINDELNESEETVVKYFERKIEHTYDYFKLEELIKNDVNIIIEDDLWLNNFEPFLNKQLISKIFDNIEEIQDDYNANNDFLSIV